MGNKEVEGFPSWLKRFDELSGPDELRQQVKLLVEKKPDLAASIIGFFGMMHFGYKSVKDLPLIVAKGDTADYCNVDYIAARSIISDWWGWPYGWTAPNIYNRLDPGLKVPVKIRKGGNLSISYIGGFPRDPRIDEHDEPIGVASCEEVDSREDESDKLMEEQKLFFESAMKYVNSIDPSFCDEDWEQILLLVEGSNNA